MRCPPLLLLSSLALVTCSSEKVEFARIMTIEDLRPGIDTTARVGDYVVDNGRVRFVFQPPGSSDTFNLWGGSLVDIHYGPDGEDRLEEAFVQCDLRAFAPDTVEIVQPGDAETPAILRFVGRDGGIPHLDTILPRAPLEAEITVDWTLPPDADTIQIDISVKDLKKTEQRDISCGLLLFEGDRYTTYVPEGGFDDSGGEASYLAAFEGDATTSWLIQRDGGPLSIFGFPPIKIAGSESEVFLANSTHKERYFLSLGPGDLASIQAQEDLLLPEAQSVTMRLATPLPEGAEADVWFRVFDPEQPPSRQAVTLAKVEGEQASLHLPIGGYETELWINGLSFGRHAFTVAAANDAISIDAKVGKVSVAIKEETLAGSAASPRQGRLVLQHESLGQVLDTYVTPNSVHLVPPGAYSVMVSAGPEHELFTSTTSITAAGVMIDATVRQVVKTDGWVSADLHVHGTRSVDSEVSQRLRLLGAAAEGLDILVSTDHDVVADYSQTLTEMDLEGTVAFFPGCEVSPLWGHTNGFPLYGLNGQWKAPWFSYDVDRKFEGGFTPYQVVQTLKQLGAEVVQHNHPRSSSGVFNHIELDPITGVSVAQWPEADAVEVLNGKRGGEYDEVLLDLFGIYKAGKRITATGTSDSHGDTGLGYARTYIFGAGHSARDIDQDALWAGLRGGAAVASLGIFLEVEAKRGSESTGVGGQLSAGGPIELRIRAQAPSWVDVNQVRIYQSGNTIAERVIGPEDAPTEAGTPALRLDWTTTATPAAGDFIMVEVRGGRSPPFIDNAVALSNPIWIAP